jgi:hypothetical protein
VLDFLGGIDLPCLFLLLYSVSTTKLINAKFVILLSSLTAGIVGFLSLKKSLKVNPDENNN